MKKPLPTKKQRAAKHFKIASDYDGAGKEQDAETEYRKVLTIGPHLLPKSNQPQFYLQFGSTLRNTGKFRKSEAILKQGIRKFPRFRALKLFLALTQYSGKNQKAAMQALLTDALDNPDFSIRIYSRALKYYSKSLR